MPKPELERFARLWQTQIQNETVTIEDWLSFLQNAGTDMNFVLSIHFCLL